MTECWQFDHDLCKWDDPRFCNHKSTATGISIKCPRIPEPSWWEKLVAHLKEQGFDEVDVTEIYINGEGYNYGWSENTEKAIYEFFYAPLCVIRDNANSDGVITIEPDAENDDAYYQIAVLSTKKFHTGEILHWNTMNACNLKFDTKEEFNDWAEEIAKKIRRCKNV